MALTTVTGTFQDGAGNALQGSVTFTPSDDLTDLADSAFYASVPITIPFDANGQFSVSLRATDSPNLAPEGWTWNVTVSIGWSAPNSGASPGPGVFAGSFPFLLPSSPSTVDITALMPAGFSIMSSDSAGGVIIPPAIGYLPLAGGTATGTIVFAGPTPLQIPSGAAAGYVLTSDASGNGSWVASAGGGGGSGVGVTVSGTPANGLALVATSGTAASWQAPAAAKRVVTLTVSSATYTPNCATTDVAIIATPAANFTVANPAGTPTDGQALTLRIRSGSTAYTPTWGTGYSGSTAVPLPAACTVSAVDYLGFAWNATSSRWHLLSYSPGF